MRRQMKRTACTAGAILLCAFLASAQGPGRKGIGMYDTKTETTIKGTVDSVNQGSRGPMMMGTHLIVKTADGTTEVMLGPSKFVSDQGFSFAKGDSVEVTGSKVTMGGKESLIAREIVKDGKTLTLRDKTGKPEWSGQMMMRKQKTQ